MLVVIAVGVGLTNQVAAGKKTLKKGEAGRTPSAMMIDWCNVLFPIHHIF